MQGQIKKLFIQEAKDGDGMDLEFIEEMGFNQSRLVNLLQAYEQVI